MAEPVERRVRGALEGLLVGDAVGTTVEFAPPGSFAPVTDMVGGGPFDLPAGAFTDDGSMALCLAESLVRAGRLDNRDALQRYVRWRRDGHLSSVGRCFDIGTATATALDRFEATGDAECGATDGRTAGNGSLMRLAPAALAAGPDVDAAVVLAARQSRATHAAPQAVDACRLYGAMIAAAACGASRDEVLDPGFWRWGALHPEVAAVAAGSYRTAEPPTIRGTGYVVRSLEAALWALHRHGGFREGTLAAVNLGEDADTTAAVHGQLAGALVGVDGIPAEWRGRLPLRDAIDDLAAGLWRLAADGGVPVDRPDAYWVEPGVLLVGEYPGARDGAAAADRLDALLDLGVRTVVDLTEADEGLAAYADALEALARRRGVEVQHRRVAIRDVSVPDDPAVVDRALEAVDAAAGRGDVAYLHCWGGIGRTGTVVACRLARRHGIDGDEALTRIDGLRARSRKRHRPSPETSEQRAFVRAWAAAGGGGASPGPRPR